MKRNEIMENEIIATYQEELKIISKHYSNLFTEIYMLTSPCPDNQLTLALKEVLKKNLLDLNDELFSIKKETKEISNS